LSCVKSAMVRGHKSLRLAKAAAATALAIMLFASPTTRSFASSASAGSGIARRSGPPHVLPARPHMDSAEGFASLPAAAAGLCGGWASIARLAAVAAVIVGVCAGAASPSHAFFGLGKSGEIIGEFPASGMIFKDTLDVERITDPKVKGVTLYQTDFAKGVLDKAMAGNLLQSDSGSSGLACIADGPVLIAKDLNKDRAGEEIFSENKGIGKAIKIRRVYDERSKNLVYAVFTERFQKGDDNSSRFKSVACAIHVTGEQ